MKKKYSKPVVVVEKFDLSTDIAAGCEKRVDTHLGGQCGIPYAGSVVFLQTVQGCTKKIEDGAAIFNGLCYHIPYEDYTLFNS